MILSLSQRTSENLRGKAVALFAPLWEKVLSFKYFLFHPTQPSPFSHFSIEENQQQLQLENQLLKTELAFLQKQIDEQERFLSQIPHSSIKENTPLSTITENSLHLQRSLNVTKCCLKAIPARVIFRSLDTWNNALWINVGDAINASQESLVIGLNSPVVVGRAVVGIIDYVGFHQSRVRLISDSRLTPSVRCTRGEEQDFLMSEYIDSLLQQLNHRRPFSFSVEKKQQLLTLLQELKQKIEPLKKTTYLAKGILLGSSSSSRLGQRVSLKGTGFNYDFPDEEGESRDLRNGKCRQCPEEKGIPILKINDVLVTTGMDGIFPPGFEVATVTHIDVLKEGDYFYNIEAKPIALGLEELTLVFVLPPVSEEDIPK